MKIKPTKLEIHLYDALENLIEQEYADGMTKWGEKRANNVLYEFNVIHAEKGFRHDGKWIYDTPMGYVIESIKELTK